LAHHYLRLIVDDHSYGGLGLSGWVARSRRVRLSRRLDILWLIVADHDSIYIGCIYMVQTSCIPIYFSATHYTLPRKLPFSGQCERRSRRLVSYKFSFIVTFWRSKNPRKRWNYYNRLKIIIQLWICRCRLQFRCINFISIQ
jgi:hypothetical protein